jgi:hypothetical protein
MINTTVHTALGEAFVTDDGFGPDDDNEIFWEPRPMELLIHAGDDFENNICPVCKAELIH